MTSRIFDLALPESYQPALKAACEALSAGEVVLVPTDTVYGLACKASDEAAVHRLFELKQRQRSKPFALLVPDAAYAWRERLASPAPSIQQLANALFPGPVTLLVDSGDLSKVAPSLRTPKLGLRVPDYDFVLALAERCGPLALTSANLSGRGEPSSRAQVLADWRNRLPVLALAPANHSLGRSSTVIDCTVTPPQILRGGALPKDKLASYLEKFSDPGA